MSKSLKTPMGSVRGLGSAKEGAGHFIGQRVSAIAMLVLVPWFLFSLIYPFRFIMILIFSRLVHFSVLLPTILPRL